MKARKGLAARTEHADSMRVVAAIRAGSVSAWHDFVHTYSPVILHVIRRYMPHASADEHRSAYVSVLESLYRGDLFRYEGRARLSTFLFVHARNRCFDWRRQQEGRHAMPAWVAQLPPLDRAVYSLYYRQGCSREDIYLRLTSNDQPLTMDALADVIERLEERIDDVTRRRTAFDLQARAIGYPSGRVLEYVQWLRQQIEVATDKVRPDVELQDRDVQRMLDSVRDLVQRLPEIERRVIDLRYFERRTARETAAAMRIASPRAVYALESRALRHLRRYFGS